MILALKILISAGLVWYAFQSFDARAVASTISGIPLYAIAFALGLLLLQMCAAALRLQRLLRILGYRLRFESALDAVAIGSFFSQTFISFVGGDAMRVWRIVRRNVSLGIAAKAVFYDRVFGFAGHIVLILAFLPILLDKVIDPVMRVGLVIALIAGLAALLVFFLLRRLPSRFAKLRALQILTEVAHDAMNVARSPKNACIIVGLSVGIQVLGVLAIFVVGNSVKAGFTVVDALALIPPVLFLSMLPISFAGWGVREGAMVVALGLIGVPASLSLALSVTYGLCLLALSLPGGFLWFLARAPSKASSSAGLKA